MANLRVNNIFGESGKDSNGSALFNGTDYLTAANASAFRVNQGSGQDFTIEAWIYLKEAPSTNAQIASIYHTSGNQRSYMLYVSSSLELKFNYASSGTAGSVSTLNAGSVPTNEWVHVAITNDTSATTARLFKNGFLKDDDTGAHTTYYANTTGDFVIGQNFPAGFISNLHIVRGTCKYTGDFTPSKEPIEEDSNTTVLCLNSRLDVLNDDKSNTFTQTAAGGVKASSFIPFDRSDSGNVFNGPISLNTQGYMYFPTGNTTQRGRGRAVSGAGYQHPATPSYTKSIDYIEIQSMGNAIDFGDLITIGGWMTALSSSTRGCFAGMGGGAGAGDAIEFVTIATTGNALDFGNLTVSRNYNGGTGNNTRGLIGGGYASNALNTIDYITFATTGDATDFGDLQAARTTHESGCSSGTRAVWGGGTVYTPSGTVTDLIGYVTIATTGNASDFGNLTQARRAASACSSSTRGIWSGGYTPTYVNTIDFITIATTGNASDFGDSIWSGAYKGGTSNGTRGIWVSGRQQPSPGRENIIEFVTIATTGNSADFGDSAVRDGNGSTSDSHGGLS